MSDVVGEMLEAGTPEVEVMTEYVRACGRLGHPTPEPAQLVAAYTAEEGMDLQALDDDARALSAAAAVAEEARLLQDHARRMLDAAWQGAGAAAAADHLRRQADAASAAVDGLRGAATALGELRNRLWQLVDAKVDTTLSVEARGLRTEWLSAARTVTTGAGDRVSASELVATQVAPFVANDVGVDWVSSMRDTESAIRQAYSAAAAVMTEAATVVFDSPGTLGSVGLRSADPVAAEQVSFPAGPPLNTAPAGYAPAPMGWPEPTQTAAPPAAPAATMPAATMPSATVPPVPAPAPGPDPLAAPPMSSQGGLGGGMSPLGSGLSGLSGAGQSLADMLGGLLGSGGDPLADGLGGTDDLDPSPEDERADSELGEGDEDDEDHADEGDDDDNEDAVDEAAADDEPVDGEIAPEDPATEAAAAEPVAPAEPVLNEPVSTPVPEPLAEPIMATPTEPAPADTPCEIAADELPQAGP